MFFFFFGGGWTFWKHLNHNGAQRLNCRELPSFLGGLQGQRKCLFLSALCRVSIAEGGLQRSGVNKGTSDFRVLQSKVVPARVETGCRFVVAALSVAAMWGRVSETLFRRDMLGPTFGHLARKL